MISVLLGLIGISICALTTYEAVIYWKNVCYVKIKDYAMMVYYSFINLYGIVCICC